MGAEGPTLWEGDGAGIAGKRTLGQWRVPDPRRGHFKGLLWQPFGGTRERCQDLGKRWSGGQGSSSPDPAQAVAFVRQLRRSQLPEPHFPQSPLLDVGKHLFSAGKDSESLLASFRDLPPHPASAHSSRLPGPGRQTCPVYSGYGQSLRPSRQHSRPGGITRSPLGPTDTGKYPHSPGCKLSPVRSRALTPLSSTCRPARSPTLAYLTRAAAAHCHYEHRTKK